MSFNEVLRQRLWSDVEENVSAYPHVRPKLAHYTSLQVLESILKNDELWLSHPLLMNDTDEMRWGIIEGQKEFTKHQGLAEACRTKERYQTLQAGFDENLVNYLHSHSRNVYVACFCVHEKEDEEDGLLSMWRAYGANGEGVAIVFDTAKLDAQEDAPLILAPVSYLSSDARRKWITDQLDMLSTLIRENEPSEDELESAAADFLERLKVFSLFTKHKGFSEEREWRLIYMSDRDNGERYKPMISYLATGRGIHPKLKLKLQGEDAVPLGVSDLVDTILLGPAIAGPLSEMATASMLQSVGKAEMKDRIRRSSTPFRPY